MSEVAGLLILPLSVLLLLVARDRSARIEQAQQRLEMVAHERARLQLAVQRLGEALAAKLDFDALADVVVHGSIEALDAESGRLSLYGSVRHRLEVAPDERAAEALRKAAEAAERLREPCQLACGEVWALALPCAVGAGDGDYGALAVARGGRAFRADEQQVLQALAERACAAAGEILAHRRLREQALTDPLTGLGNRRRLIAEGEQALRLAAPSRPLTLALFDLNGFKGYNDAFGHQAGDALLARAGRRLAATAAGLEGSAYRLGGDEFCALVPVAEERRAGALRALAAALEQHTPGREVGAAFGAASLPSEADTLEGALQLADERMYRHKRTRSPVAGEQAREVLLSVINARLPALGEHCGEVARLCRRVGRRLGIGAEELDELVRAAELRDLGHVAIPDEILRKGGPLDDREWELVRRHTVLGARILGAAPSLEAIAATVRASHERWDGNGYPDGLRGAAIPLAARIVAVCDAYEAMRDGRSYRPARSASEARRELRREAGAQFDPAVVDALLLELDSDLEQAPGGGERAQPAR